MTTTATTPAIIVTVAPSLAELKAAVREALENVNEAFRAEACVTIEDGFTPEQVEAATNQANAAYSHYEALYDQLSLAEAFIIRQNARNEAARYCTELNAATVEFHLHAGSQYRYAYRFQGQNRTRKAAAIINFLRRYTLPYTAVVTPDYGVIVRF